MICRLFEFVFMAAAGAFATLQDAADAALAEGKKAVHHDGVIYAVDETGKPHPCLPMGFVNQSGQVGNAEYAVLTGIGLEPDPAPVVTETAPAAEAPATDSVIPAKAGTQQQQTEPAAETAAAPADAPAAAPETAAPDPVVTGDGSGTPLPELVVTETAEAAEAPAADPVIPAEAGTQQQAQPAVETAAAPADAPAASPETAAADPVIETAEDPVVTETAPATDAPAADPVIPAEAGTQQQQTEPAAETATAPAAPTAAEVSPDPTQPAAGNWWEKKPPAK